MKLYIGLLGRIPLQALAFVLAFLPVAAIQVHACTIFVLIDTNRALFCNNEDWLITRTRINEFRGRDLKRLFELKPVSYFAKLK
jgi:hypothetical protein